MSHARLQPAPPRGTASSRRSARPLSSLRTALTALAPLAVALPQLAHAHFILVDPPVKYKQDTTLGDPQKAAPCGYVAGSEVASGNQPTTYKAGQTISITINETIFHPGHYRVTIGPDPTKFVEPPVTAGTTACGSTTIMDPPVLPVIADGLLQHTTKFTTPQTVQVKLPDGFTCQNCTLQVFQWMSNHGLNNPGGCFYHHCSAVNIVANDDLGVTQPADLSSPPDMATIDVTMPTGCSCNMGGAPIAGGTSTGILAVLLGLAVRRRRQARR